MLEAIDVSCVSEPIAVRLSITPQNTPRLLAISKALPRDPNGVWVLGVFQLRSLLIDIPQTNSNRVPFVYQFLQSDSNDLGFPINTMGLTHQVVFPIDDAAGAVRSASRNTPPVRRLRSIST